MVVLPATIGADMIKKIMRTLLGRLKRGTETLKDLFFFRIVVVHPENLIKRADVLKWLK